MSGNLPHVVSIYRVFEQGSWAYESMVVRWLWTAREWCERRQGYETQMKSLPAGP